MEKDPKNGTDMTQNHGFDGFGDSQGCLNCTPGTSGNKLE